MLHTRIKLHALTKKSRLAGFFLSLCLLSCTEAPPVAGHLAFQQAQAAAADGLSIKSQELLALAIQQGYPGAVDQWLLQTREALGPLQQLQQLRQWQVQTLTEQQKHQLGLWRQTQSAQPALGAIRPAQCQLFIQPVLTSALSIRQWQLWQQQWQTSQLATLPLCLQAPVLLDTELLACTEQPGQRIRCDEQRLWPLAINNPARLMLVLAGRGGASFNNGLLTLPEQASLPLLQHELSHAFGFIDEYAYPPARQRRECQPGRMTANVLFSVADLPAYLRHWQLKAEQVRLTPVATCGEVATALKVVSNTSHMQHYELPIPPLYLQLIKQQLQQPAEIMPVSYYFAAMARRTAQLQHWPALMQTAAEAGYPPAVQALAQAAPATGVSSTTR